MRLSFLSTFSPALSSRAFFLSTVATILLANVCSADDADVGAIREAVRSMFLGDPAKSVQAFVASDDLGLLSFANFFGKPEEVPDLKDIRVRVTGYGEVAGAFVTLPDRIFGGMALRKVDGSWKIDPRYLIDHIDARNGIKIRGLMYFALTHNVENIKKVIANPENAQKFIMGDRLPGADIGVLQDVIAGASVVRVRRGDNYVINGKVAVNNEELPGNGKVLYAVLYSDMEFSVRLLSTKVGWLIDDEYVFEQMEKIHRSQMP